MLSQVEDRQGALYADITLKDLGYPIYTPLCHIPIAYGNIWERIGEAFVEEATATCPVDTGYLRDHIGSTHDNAGVELWSDAEYSTYQEYGTQKMKAQPYFEAAMLNAMDSVQSQCAAQKNQFFEIDSDMAFLMQGCTGDLESCYYYLDRLDRVIDFMNSENAEMAAESGLYYDITPLYDARYDIEARIEELMKYEGQAAMGGQGILGFLAQLFAEMLAMLIISILTFPFQLVEPHSSF